MVISSEANDESNLQVFNNVNLSNHFLIVPYVNNCGNTCTEQNYMAAGDQNTLGDTKLFARKKKFAKMRKLIKHIFLALASNAKSFSHQYFCAKFGND